MFSEIEDVINNSVYGEIKYGYVILLLSSIFESMLRKSPVFINKTMSKFYHWFELNGCRGLSMQVKCKWIEEW